MSKKTLSEKLFEDFCNENSIEWSPIIPKGQDSRKHPDYFITCSNNTVVVEVKEIGQSPADRARLQLLK